MSESAPTKHLNSQVLQPALDVIHHSGVICYPTEGVWGLGCHPQSALAFNKLLALKQRPLEKGVILIAATIEQVRPYAHIDKTLLAHLTTVWPGFVTCILPKAATCPSYLAGAHDSIAVRLSAYTPLNTLCQAANTALVSTSANLSGQAPAADILQAKKTFGDGVDAYIDAPLGGAAKPSRIIRWQNGNMQVIRE